MAIAYFSAIKFLDVGLVMDIDKITVALATYRRPSGLHDAIEALASQKFKRLQVLVSDDDPNEVNRQRVENEKRFEINYFPQSQRKGVLHNHLSMINGTCSDIFMFHGDDDRLLPNALITLSEPLKASQEYDAVFANYRIGPDFEHTRHVMISNLPFARYWRHPRRIVRMLAYYLCPTFLGKQNLFYALYRSEVVRKIDLDRAIPPRAHLLNLDEMYAFQAVSNGKVLILASECYFFAAGNTKHYTDSNSAKSKSFSALFQFLSYEWTTLFDYLRNVGSLKEYWILILLFPIKLICSFSWRYARWLK